MMRRIRKTLSRWLRDFQRPRKAPYSLATELEFLERNIRTTNARLAEINKEFWANGGTCCPSCGSLEYRELVEKQDRRIARRHIVRNKLLLPAKTQS